MATSSAAAAASGQKGAAAADQASGAPARGGNPQITLTTRDEVEWLQNAQKVAEKRARSPRRGRGKQPKDAREQSWWHSEGDKHQDKRQPKSEASPGRGKSKASRGRSARCSPRSRSRPLSVENRALDGYQGGGWWRQQKPRDDDIQDKGAGQELQGDQQGEEMKWGREAYPPSEPSEQLPT